VQAPIRRLSAHPLTTAATEMVIVAAAYVTYNVLRIFVEGGEARAVEHAFGLVTIEQTLGLFHEASVQRAIESQPWLAQTMKLIYLHAYLPMLVTAAAVMFLRDRALYRSYRNALFASAAVGLVIFAVLPVAPPRMLPEYGFFDPIHAFGTNVAHKNEFAAVPSFHFGFTLLAAIGVSHAFRFNRWLCAALSLFPVIMLVSIVSTANHFFLDAAAGGAIVMLAWSWFVARKHVWLSDDEAPPAWRVSRDRAW
jgi:hypothetical protein